MEEFQFPPLTRVDKARAQAPAHDEAAVESVFFWIVGPLRTPLFIICAAIFSNMFLYGLFIGLAPWYKSKMDLTSFELGTLFSSFSMVSVVSCPIVGLLLRELPYKSSFIFGGVLCAVSALLMAVSETFFALLLARFLHGLGGTVVWLAGPSIVCELFGVQSRTKAMGVVYIYATAAFLVGTVLGGNSFDWTGRSEPILISVTIMNLFTTGLLITSLPSDRSYDEYEEAGYTPATSTHGHGAHSWGEEAIIASQDTSKSDTEYLAESGWEIYKELWNSHTVRLLLVSVFLYSTTNIIVQAFIPSWVKAYLHISVSGGADLYALLLVAKVASQPFFGRLTERIGPNMVSGVGLIAYGLTLPMLPMAETVGAILFTYTLLGLTMTATILPTFISLSNQVELIRHKSRRTPLIANTMWLFSFMLGAVVSPMIVGRLLDYIDTASYFSGHSARFYHTAILGFLGAVLGLLHGPYFIYCTRADDAAALEKVKGFKPML
mmetsp:Transcript_26814/g.61789  ORF Transcript_26814/g.61789 Transcript_26814/m.61789 type:complete len:493 (+) Transcript_26814:56-1534(+)|eukprot:CAMPEP_0114558618 /NCGR_PEP_ID=MMETSP0114-20121206/10481_1 /TAXON_ID=31324 /ORGANISM="Goniomonas sp, Strain m" /LENGTH=492 /DNA_ID=CAMNT_0001744027 /DNA_START=44 /DNA_END=1522 /DNA_ORIENTATION=-